MLSERPVMLTAQGKADLERELELLERTKIPALAQRVQELTRDGDVSDNAEYEDTKEELVMLEARAREIRDVLRRARVAPQDGTPDVVQFGSLVTLVDAEGAIETWTLVSPEEANMAQGKISTSSPVGAALLGKRTGDTVTVNAPAGETTYRITSVK